MNIYDRRRERLTELLSKMTAADLYKCTGIAASSISAFHKQLPDGRYLRNIGEKTARRLESGVGKPEGWMDTVTVISGHTTESNHKQIETQWPHDLVNKDRYELLTHAEKCRVQVHMADEIEEILKARQAPKTIA